MTDANTQRADPETEPDTSGDRARSSEKRTVPAGALIVAIMVAAALGILAIVALTMGGDGDQEGAEDARIAAGRFGERFLTFEQDSLDDWKAGVLSLSTGGFSEEVDEVEDGLERLISEAELDATARVTEIFMGRVDDGQISAVLLYDRDLSGVTGARSEADRYMQLRLLHVDGEWLVDDVLDIATARAPAQSAPSAGDPAVPETEPSEPTSTTGSTPGG